MLKFCGQIINNMKIQNKLIFSYILVVMIPFIIIGASVTGYFRELALNNAIAQTTNNVDKIKGQMTNILKVPIEISNKLYFDENLQTIINTNFQSNLELFQDYRNYKEFQSLIALYTEISGIRFYHDNDTMTDNYEFTRITPEVAQSRWFQTVTSNYGIGWYYLEDQAAGLQKKLSLVRRVQFNEFRSQGVLVVAINQNLLNSILSKEPFETMIADHEGYIVAAKNPDLVGKTLDELDLNFYASNPAQRTFEAEVNGVPSNIVVDELTPESSLNGLKIVSVFSTKSITKESQRVSWIGLILITVFLGIALILVYVVSKLISKRLLHLSKQLNKVSRGDFSANSHIDGNDEIGQLSRQFNHMVASINELMDQVYESNEQNNKLEIAQKEIKLKMMASQINPHFLFNALESIRMKAHIKGEKEIANIVRLLGKLMRKNLEIGGGRTTLKEEMEIVRSYLEIQKFRYEDRLNFDLVMDPMSMSVNILPLVIQPLVENAIIHGLENREESNGLLIVRSLVIEDELYIDVIDNGMGMSLERQEEVRASLDAGESEGARIGLRNVHQRLRLYYGDNYGLTINSIVGVGTTIQFRIPMGRDRNV
ncbi:cache domain-containing sensor histidine kinase [Paenibacillus sp. DS2015]|uniref:cache domain-containing sensor histidine kinase n=1 Tax=Paenibacillus sp. DS2015 TaxID=3373917 RepID=UPI003D1B79BA